MKQSDRTFSGKTRGRPEVGRLLVIQIPMDHGPKPDDCLLELLVGIQGSGKPSQSAVPGHRCPDELRLTGTDATGTMPEN
jgi:hypothetical protein